MEIEAQITVPGVFLHDDLFESKIFDAKTAILFLGPCAEQSVCSGFGKGITINDASLVPAFDIRPNFGLHEFANRIAELVVF